MTYLEDWKNKTYEAIELTAQAERARVDAEFALSLHKAEASGSGKPAAKSATYNDQAETQDYKCADCGAEIKGSPKPDGWTAQKKADFSIRKHGRVVCFKCEQRLSAAA